MQMICGIKKIRSSIKDNERKKLNFTHTNYDLINDRNNKIGYMNVKKFKL